MKNQLLCISIIIFVLGTLLGTAQKVHSDTINGKVVVYKGYTDEQFNDLKDKLHRIIIALEKQHEIFVLDKKEEFKERIKKVNQSLDKGEIDQVKADEFKKNQAVDLARLIESHRNSIDAKIDLIRTNRASSYFDFGVEEEFENSVAISTKDGVKINVAKTNKTAQKYVRTYSGFSLSFGYNFMNGDRLSIHDFSYPNNNYFAIGYKWKTTLDKNKNNFRLIYGVEYQTHGTQLNGLRYFSQGDPTVVSPLSDILENGSMVRKAKFRQDQIVFPLHLEIGGADRKEYEDGRVRFREDGKFRVGLGGFVGFNTSSRLKLKYELDGRDIKETRINNFDNETFLYGVDAYLGWEDVTFFGRMNLNNVFKPGSENAQYIAFGIRIQ
jgi:hypothetical protein